MKLCAVQYRPEIEDIDANIKRHLSAIHAAKECGAQLIVFPELSITSYQSNSAYSLATDLNDPRFDDLQRASNALDLDVVFGFPAKARKPSATHCEIGMAWLSANRARRFYAKQRLHRDELPFFLPGAEQLVVQVQEQRVAPAICFESLQLPHAQRAAELDATVYLSSVAKSANGLAQVGLHYPEVAKRFGMWVLMSNSLGPSDNFFGQGGSAAWNKQGELLAQLDAEHEGLVILDTATGAAQAVSYPNGF